jgi:SAM-dependent methyltransferase
MTIQQFIAQGEELSKEAQVLDTLHEYFHLHASRLHHCCELFNLFGKLGEVLEVGPFFGYTPFILRPNSSSYTVLEGDDPATYPLKPLYQRHSIALTYVDLFELFGPIRPATHQLPFADSSFDTILCWETMEHLNFNPVKFVKELYRVLRPGGRICITVPNKASFQSMVALLFGRNEKSHIDSFFVFENYESNGKKAFYGFHWHEYSGPELSHLFTRVGFNVQVCSSFTAFQNHGKIGRGRKFARSLSKMGTSLFPRYGTNVYLIASK